VQTGAFGGDPREFDVASGTVTGTDATGAPRTDSYNCLSSQSDQASPQNTFCHVRVNECQVLVDCYHVGDDSNTPFDSWNVGSCS